MADQQRPIMAGLPAVAKMLVGIALLVLAGLRWHNNGWGSLVWLIAMVAMVAIRMPHSFRNRANVVVAARKDPTEVALLAGMFVTTMVLPLIQFVAGLFAFADYALPVRRPGSARSPSSPSYGCSGAATPISAATGRRGWSCTRIMRW